MATEQSKNSRKGCIRIANAGGYWGDDPFALRRQVESNTKLDYVSIDFLAEITMSILQKQKAKDPTAGYAKDFVSQIAPLLPKIKEKQIKVITNAGGVNPEACSQALFAAARAANVQIRIAVVYGDDVKEALDTLFAAGNPLAHMEDGRDFATIQKRVLSANAYFGAKPVVAALKHDPDIVLCGRVTDTGITLAAMMHEFGWLESDYDKLAHGIVAGHIIECGAQATGGNFTDWKKVTSFKDLGFPIIECHADGSFVVTKAEPSGGLVSLQTVREQLLYEMGEPESYITPDVIANFASIQLQADGPNRVLVNGVRGRPPTDLLKLSISYADGYKSSGTLIVSGPDAKEKAKCFAEIFWQKMSAELANLGLSALEHTRTELIGDDATHGPLSPQIRPSEILLRLAARDAKQESLKLFRKVLPSLILSGPSGVAVTGGAPVISEIVSYWPALLAQEHAPAAFRVLESALGADGIAQLTEVAAQSNIRWTVTKGVASNRAPDSVSLQSHTGTQHSKIQVAHARTVSSESQALLRVPLMRIAHARSGDKGDTANIGLIARSLPLFLYLKENITAQLVKESFGDMCHGVVKRYSVDNLWALNFLLESSLDGGGTVSLHLDAQGKTFSQALLRLMVDVPAELLNTVAPEDLPTSGELVP